MRTTFDGRRLAGLSLVDQVNRESLDRDQAASLQKQLQAKLAEAGLEDVEEDRAGESWFDMEVEENTE